MYRIASSLISILILLLINFKSLAQGHFPVISMEILTVPVDGFMTSSGQPDISDTTLFKVEMKIILYDTLNISSFRVELKSDANSSINLLSKMFNYTQSGNFADGTSFHRNGYEVIIGLGDFLGIINPYASLIVETTTGVISDPIIYN